MESKNLHHTQDFKCQLCELKLSECNPRLRDFFYIIKKEFPHLHISCGFRNKEDQDKAFHDGKTRVRFPNSKHNVMMDGIPRSRAIDLFELTDSYGASFKKEIYEAIANFMKVKWLDSECPVEWSGTWTLEKDKIVELNHFQLRTTP